MEVINNAQGKPKLNLSKLNLKVIEDIDLSLSHCREYAVANVTLLGK